MKKNNTNNISVTVIAEGTKIVGMIESEQIYIYGTFEGDIVSNGTVTISHKGLVDGNIKAYSLVVGGSLKGKASCKNIQIIKNGFIKGSISSEDLTIEAGGFFEGDSHRIAPKDQKAITDTPIVEPEIASENNKKK